MINGKITKIKNNNEEVLFPITTSQAVLMSDGVTNVQDAIEENKQNIEANKTSILSLEEGIEDLKLSVSNGKSLVASAITDKGVTTSNEDTFQTMADNISKIETGYKFSVNCESINYDAELETIYYNEDVSTLPYNFYRGCAVVLNNEIHILGGETSNTKHYKWDGSSWISVSTLPYSFYNGCAVIHNNEIHILGGTGNTKKHYKWNGTSWTSVSTLPYSFCDGCAVSCNNEIHIMGAAESDTSNTKKHYKWNGTSWTSVSTIGYNFYRGCATVLNNEIHILGFTPRTMYHNKWNGSSWISLNSSSVNFYDGCAVAYNNEIHVLGNSTENILCKRHFVANAFEKYKDFRTVATLPYTFYEGCAVVYKNEIHLLGTKDSSYAKKHIKIKKDFSVKKIKSLYDNGQSSFSIFGDIVGGCSDTFFASFSNAKNYIYSDISGSAWGAFQHVTVSTSNNVKLDLRGYSKLSVDYSYSNVGTDEGWGTIFIGISSQTSDGNYDNRPDLAQYSEDGIMNENSNELKERKKISVDITNVDEGYFCFRNYGCSIASNVRIHKIWLEE